MCYTVPGNPYPDLFYESFGSRERRDSNNVSRPMSDLGGAISNQNGRNLSCLSIGREHADPPGSG